MGDHAGHVHGPTSGTKLWISLGVTLLFCVGEAVAGLVSHSLALLSDAAHNVSDALALGLAAYAVRAMRKPASSTHTFGYYRVSTLTALFNSGTLVAVALFLGVEAASRFRRPEAVEGNLMIWVAGISVLMNTLIAVALSGDAKKSLNSRAAFVHMTGDALSSLAVLIAGLVLHYTGWPYVDPLVSLLIAGFILWSAYGILRESTNILMERTPEEVDLEVITTRILTVEPICGVHDLHVWTMGEGRHLLSCHIAVPEGTTVAASMTAIETISRTLHDEFSIEHVTIQTEEHGSFACGKPAELLCNLSAHSH